MSAEASEQPYGAEWETVTIVSKPLALAAAVTLRKADARPVSEHSSTSRAMPCQLSKSPALIPASSFCNRSSENFPLALPPPMEMYFVPTRLLNTGAESDNAWEGSAQPLNATPRLAPAGALPGAQVLSQYPITAPAGTGDGDGVGVGVGVGVGAGLGPTPHHSPTDASHAAWLAALLQGTAHWEW